MALGRNSRRRTLVVGVIAVLVFAASVAIAESQRGKIYMFTKSTTMSARAGTPCLQDKETAEQSYCDRSFHCPDGQVARALIENVEVIDGVGSINGVGLACVDPNEVYLSEDVGAFGQDFGGEVFRDSCDTGYFLTGAYTYSSDRRNVTGIRRHCRRYWPVAEQQGANLYGSGRLEEWVGCPDGRFVTGLKVSYYQDSDTQDGSQTILRNFRFYCSEMRHWIAEPEDARDPRDPKTRR